MNETNALREHLVELLDGGSAHIRMEDVLSGFPTMRMNERAGNSPHSAWELLEHIRIAQWDILEFSRNAGHVSPDFPDGYWPVSEGTDDDWSRSAKQALSDLSSMAALVANPATDLFAVIPHGSGQTVLREAMLVADHNAYHLGQLMLLKKMLSNESS
ncbi:MAG: DinB family protein [Chloracidobacterium sp.]|nr:DinB family protein [Chloracidobacterium sp.]